VVGDGMVTASTLSTDKIDHTEDNQRGDLLVHAMHYSNYMYIINDKGGSFSISANPTKTSQGSEKRLRSYYF